MTVSALQGISRAGGCAWHLGDAQSVRVAVATRARARPREVPGFPVSSKLQLPESSRLRVGLVSVLPVASRAWSTSFLAHPPTVRSQGCYGVSLLEDLDTSSPWGLWHSTETPLLEGSGSPVPVQGKPSRVIRAEVVAAHSPKISRDFQRFPGGVRAFGLWVSRVPEVASGLCQARVSLGTPILREHSAEQAANALGWFLTARRSEGPRARAHGCLGFGQSHEAWAPQVLGWKDAVPRSCRG